MDSVGVHLQLMQMACRRSRLAEAPGGEQLKGPKPDEFPVGWAVLATSGQPS